MSGKVDLDRWGPHLQAAKREGKSLTEYACSRGLRSVAIGIVQRVKPPS